MRLKFLTVLAAALVCGLTVTACPPDGGVVGLAPGAGCYAAQSQVQVLRQQSAQYGYAAPAMAPVFRAPAANPYYAPSSGLLLAPVDASGGRTTGRVKFRGVQRTR